MKKLLTVLTILVSATLRAEYNGYHIRFEITTRKGESKIGYTYVTSGVLNTDSLKNTDYLKKALGQRGKDWSERDSVVYFEERIKYEYRNINDPTGDKIPIYTLNNVRAISSGEIKSIVIVEMIDQTYLIGVSNPLSLADTTWTNKEPLLSYAFGGYLCYHQVFIHKNTPKTQRIIEALQNKQDALEGVELNYDNGDKADQEFWELIQGLFGEKVVVVSECTC